MSRGFLWSFLRSKRFRNPLSKLKVIIEIHEHSLISEVSESQQNHEGTNMWEKGSPFAQRVWHDSTTMVGTNVGPGGWYSGDKQTCGRTWLQLPLVTILIRSVFGDGSPRINSYNIHRAWANCHHLENEEQGQLLPLFSSSSSVLSWGYETMYGCEAGRWKTDKVAQLKGWWSRW